VIFDKLMTILHKLNGIILALTLRIQPPVFLFPFTTPALPHSGASLPPPGSHVNV